MSGETHRQGEVLILVDREAGSVHIRDGAHTMLVHRSVRSVRLICRGELDHHIQLPPAPSRRATARLPEDSRAVTALEYALIGALVALAIVGGATALGTSISTVFSHVASSINKG